jgi:hypothetical protein
MYRLVEKAGGEDGPGGSGVRVGVGVGVGVSVGIFKITGRYSSGVRVASSAPATPDMLEKMNAAIRIIIKNSGQGARFM